MKTFDYARAWHDVARPAYFVVTPEARAVLAEVATVARDLHQAPDLTQRWPDDGGALRAKFEALSTPDLAFAARVIYFTGHWFPTGGDLDLPGRAHGAYWKFSHYADQVLRARLALAGGEAGGTPAAAGVSYGCHEGMIRLGYGSRDLWVFEEVAPATDEGLRLARDLGATLQTALDAAGPTKARGARETAAMQWFDALRAAPAGGAWGPWAPWRGVVDRYLVDESEIIRPAATIDWAARIAGVRADLARKVADQEMTAAGLIWLLERQIETDNVIFYAHAQRWGIGWRHTLTDAAIAEWLDLLAEFPYPYDIRGYQAYRERQNAATTAGRS